MISIESIIVVAGYVLLAVVLIFFYRFSNKVLIKKIVELKKEEHRLEKLIDKINKARMRESRQIKKRIEEIEEQIGSAAPEEEKELAEEKVFVRRR
ncbi:MAG: hypothetical protein ABH986_06540 [archaeon]